VLLATLLVCVLLYEYLLRRVAFLRLAFGIKSHDAGRLKVAGEKSPAVSLYR
jgi:hypothetical protein